MSFFHDTLGKIRLDYLNTFKKLLQYQSFSETAKKLGKTQSAISQQLDQLEQALGVILIERDAKNFKVTAQGEIVIECISKIFANLEEMQNQLVRIATDSQKRFLYRLLQFLGNIFYHQSYKNSEQIIIHWNFKLKSPIPNKLYKICKMRRYHLPLSADSSRIKKKSMRAL
jgi:hypothetical protein